MSCTHASAINIKEGPIQSSECTQCFINSRDRPLSLCLSCYNIGCLGDESYDHAKTHYTNTKHPLVLNIYKKAKPVEVKEKIMIPFTLIPQRDAPPTKLSKLAINAVPSADDPSIYDIEYSVTCFACDSYSLPVSEIQDVIPITERIRSSKPLSQIFETQAWESSLEACEHSVGLQIQSDAMSPDLSHCTSCELKENLWLCLMCGNVGCGRQQIGGVAGHGHALAHFTSSQHPLCVKLGSIDPVEKSVDVYCYACDEERLDPDIWDHLLTRGIDVAKSTKTEKSLVELQIEQNMNWQFSMTDASGTELTLVSGPGLVGLKNIGNSCYIAGTLQALLSTRTFSSSLLSSFGDHPVVCNIASKERCLQCQSNKIANGLLSPRFSEKVEDGKVANEQSPYAEGLAVFMFKSLIGGKHPEFSTMRQQDAYEFYSHLTSMLSNLSGPSSEQIFDSFKFELEQRLECRNCHGVSYKKDVQDSISVPLASSDGSDSSLSHCLQSLTAPEDIEFTCRKCKSRLGGSKQALFATTPTYLVCHIRRFQLENWIPKKLETNISGLDDELLADEFLSNGKFHAEGEIIIDDNDIDDSLPGQEEVINQFVDMGFPADMVSKAIKMTKTLEMESIMTVLLSGDVATQESSTKVNNSSNNNELDNTSHINNLMDMGFSRNLAAKALKESHNDYASAVEWIFANGDDTSLEVETVVDAVNESSVVSGRIFGSPDGNAVFRPIALVCHKGGSVHAGHYITVAKRLDQSGEPQWTIFNDEKVALVHDISEYGKYTYIVILERV